MTTIRDIAKLSGFSTGTVSRVINNHPDVNPATREKIEAIIRETGFQPNANAKFLKQTISSTITVIVKGIQNSFFETILEEMQEVFFSLWRAQAVTTVIVTHYVEEALYLGQKIVVLSSAPGRVLSVMENPHFARREASGDFSVQKARLRGWLTGKGAGT